MSTIHPVAIPTGLVLAPDQSAPRWYAVQTRGRHEKKVASQLIEKRIETFLPTLREVHRWSDRKKIVEVPLFPSYTFVRIQPQQERISVLQTEGVVRIVASGGELAPVEDKQIEGIRSLLASGVAVTMYPFLKIGQRIRVRGGCLHGLEGILLSRPRESTLIVSVDAIQRSIAIDCGGYQIEPV